MEVLGIPIYCVEDFIIGGVFGFVLGGFVGAVVLAVFLSGSGVTERR